jgi:hypothetical protein
MGTLWNWLQTRLWNLLGFVVWFCVPFRRSDFSFLGTACLFVLMVPHAVTTIKLVEETLFSAQ